MNTTGLGAEGRTLLEQIFKKLVMRLRTGFIWLSTVTSGRMYLNQSLVASFCIRRGIFCVLNLRKIL